jgi:hypothetical protein
MNVIVPPFDRRHVRRHRQSVSVSAVLMAVVMKT